MCPVVTGAFVTLQTRHVFAILGGKVNGVIENSAAVVVSTTGVERAIVSLGSPVLIVILAALLWLFLASRTFAGRAHPIHVDLPWASRTVYLLKEATPKMPWSFYSHTFPVRRSAIISTAPYGFPTPRVYPCLDVPGMVS